MLLNKLQIIVADKTHKFNVFKMKNL